jgi:antitoxin ParD1/3/4
MEIKLTPEEETLITRKLESGQYASASDVVRDALHLLEAYDAEYQERLTALRAEIQKGLDSGPGIPAEEVREHMRAFIARETKGRARKRA